jgi:hypothetical protein
LKRNDGMHDPQAFAVGVSERPRVTVTKKTVLAKMRKRAPYRILELPYDFIDDCLCLLELLCQGLVIKRRGSEHP